MIVYNVSVKILNDYADEWVAWMKAEHIPHVMKSECFQSYSFYQLLDQDETEGKTFVVQYFASDMEAYTRYKDIFAKPLQTETANKFTDKFVAFRTLMQSI